MSSLLVLSHCSHSPQGPLFLLPLTAHAAFCVLLPLTAHTTPGILSSCSLLTQPPASSPPAPARCSQSPRHPLLLLSLTDHTALCVFSSCSCFLLTQPPNVFTLCTCSLFIQPPGALPVPTHCSPASSVLHALAHCSHSSCCPHFLLPLTDVTAAGVLSSCSHTGLSAVPDKAAPSTHNASGPAEPSAHTVPAQ